MPAPRKFDHDEARRRHAAGESLAALAREFNVTATAVRRAVDDRLRARMDAASTRFTRERRRLPCLEPGCDRIVWVNNLSASGYCQKHHQTITAEHGSESMYVRHRCRCGKCVAAAAAAKRARRERAKVPCSHGCGTMVEGTNRRDNSKPFECHSCAVKRIQAEKRTAA